MQAERRAGLHYIVNQDKGQHPACRQGEIFEIGRQCLSAARLPASPSAGCMVVGVVGAQPVELIAFRRCIYRPDVPASYLHPMSADGGMEKRLA